jgi:hypothetical protein
MFKLDIMIQKTMLATIIFVLLAVNSSFAQYRHQAGVRLGSYDQVVATGFTYRHHLNNNKAIEVMLNLREPIALGAFYEIFKPIGLASNLHWFYGGGAFVGFSGVDNLGIAGIAGLDYQFNEVPINLTIDWKPELSLIQSVRFRASTVAVSIRFAFLKK